MARTISQIQSDLEKLVDEHPESLAGILEALADVCNAKADHIDDNWQDHILAQAWRKASGKIATCKDKVSLIADGCW